MASHHTDVNFPGLVSWRMWDGKQDAYENPWKTGGREVTMNPRDFRTDKGRVIMSDYDTGLGMDPVVKSQNARVLRGGERDHPLLKSSGPRPEYIPQSFMLTQQYPIYGNDV